MASALTSGLLRSQLFFVVCVLASCSDAQSAKENSISEAEIAKDRMHYSQTIAFAKKLRSEIIAAAGETADVRVDLETMDKDLDCSAGRVISAPSADGKVRIRWYLWDGQRINIYSSESAEYVRASEECTKRVIALDKKLGRKMGTDE